MENYKCRACHSLDMRQLSKLANFPKAAQFFLNGQEEFNLDKSIELNLFQCKNCSLVQIANEPVDYYKKVITASSLSDQSKAKLVQEWSPIVDKYRLSGCDALEVGAGNGDFLEVLESLNINSVGMEYGNNKSKKIINDYLIGAKFDDVFDLIVCNNYLEHQPDIRGFIQAIKKHLKEDGIVYFSVPNLDYMLRKSCLYEFVADHLVYFTKTTLRNAFQTNGFEVIDIGYKNNENDLWIICRLEKMLNISKHIIQYEKIVDSVNFFLTDLKNKNMTLAIWGAGHRALALMAQAQAELATSYIIDSAGFKQNKLSPLTHLPIYGPEKLLEDPVSAILVMLPGNYADQALKWIHENKINAKITVFKDEEIGEIK